MKHDTAKLGIKDWAEADRPREKLLTQGRRQLTNAELLAILIGTGNKTESAVDLSKRMLKSCDNDLAKLAKLNVAALAKFKGIGKAKAISIIAALELGRRRKELDCEQTNLKISTSKDAYIIMKGEMADLLQEECWILLLNRSNRVVAKQRISEGGLDMTVVDPKVIFKLAFEQSATAIILVHNHPSGNLNPSDADLKLTKKIAVAGKALDLPIIDHLIITDHYFFSFADEGLI